MCRLRRTILLLAGILLLFCGGCGLEYGDSLLSLPKLPGEYVQLQKQLDAILQKEGTSYAVAETGSNRQAVQMVDVNGDGVDEAIAFFVNEDSSHMVYAFRQKEDGYETLGMAESYSSTLRAIYYPVCSSNGSMAIAMCWGFDENSTYGMTLYGFTDSGLTVLLDTQYSDLVIEDIDGDGLDELAFAVRDSITGLYSVKVYRLRGGECKPMFEVPMCLEVKSVANMVFGKLADGSEGIYVDSNATTGGYVTDVIRYDGQVASNETINQASGSGGKTWRGIAVFCTDINSDGVPDVPASRSFSTNVGETEGRYRLDWFDFSQGETGEAVDSTLHLPGENWYLRWPANWNDEVRVEKSASVNLEKTTFYLMTPDEGEGAGRIVLLSVWMFRGENREDEAALYRRLNRLVSNANGIYCYSLPEDVSGPYALTAEQVSESFHTIDISWQSEDY